MPKCLNKVQKMHKNYCCGVRRACTKSTVSFGKQGLCDVNSVCNHVNKYIMCPFWIQVRYFDFTG